MNNHNLQTTISIPEAFSTSGMPLTKSYVVWTMIILAIVHFAFNFLYLPHLKWFYLFEVLCITYYIIRLPFQHSILPLMYLFFIEGQGRIVWDYNPFFRIVFDLVCLLAVLKSLALHKKLIPKKLPVYFEVAIYLHITWFFIEIFNINSLGVFPVLATSKIYVFPLLLFSLLLFNPLDAYSQEIKRLQIFVVGMIFLETLLSWYQMFAKEKGLEQISNYYLVAMKTDVFIGSLFRPFATTMVPGLISSYLFLTVGLLFLPSWQGTLRKIATIAVVLLSGFTLFISQVRSAMIKYILILLLSAIGFSILGKMKTKMLIPNLMIGVAFYFLLVFSNLGQNVIKDIDLTESVKRVAIVSEGIEVTKHRIGLDSFLSQMTTKLLDAPLGLGPGRTGAANSLNTDLIMQDPIYSKNASWAFDNLFLALAIDFGIGMIFYTFLIIGLPLYLLARSIMLIIRKDKLRGQIVFTCAMIGIVIVSGNWGANTLPYNPDSFMFWFWMAMGINHSFDAQPMQETIHA